MKKLFAMVLSLILCISLFPCGAQALDLKQFVGYWEVQNIAIGGYTVGANYLGFDLHAIVHDDGICILTLDDEMVAGYINGYSGNYYLEDSYEVYPLTFDSQGRIHLDLSNGSSTKIDVRLRKATAERLGYNLTSYVGNYEVVSASLDGITLSSALWDMKMTVYEDGFATIVIDDMVAPLRLATQGGTVYFMDEDGKYVNLTVEGNTLSFTLEGDSSSFQFVVQKIAD